MSMSNERQQIGWATLLVSTVVMLWAAHAIAFFAHEYAHSFIAWILGWKRNPLALDYAHPTLTVFLIQLGINQNVDEVPIFASGHGHQAAVISAAGAVLGNAAITLSLGRWLYGWARKRAGPMRAMLAYWVTVASVGNMIDYVPIRTFVNGGDYTQDMWAVEQGLGWSPWTLLIVFGLPTVVAVAYFFFRIEPETFAYLFPESRGKRVFMAVLTALFLFSFYGAAGLSNGPLAHSMSMISVCAVAPLVAIGTGVRAALGGSK